MKNTITIIVLILICAILGVETYMLISTSKARNDLQSQVSQLQLENLSLTNKNEDIAADIVLVSQEKDLLSNDISDLTGTNQTLEASIQTLEETAAVLVATTESQKAELIDKGSEIISLMNQNNAIKNKFMCSSPLTNVDFSSNKSVNDALAAYVKRTKNMEEPISAHYFNLIWTGSKYSIHTVEVHSEKDRINYLWKFTVYFRGESYGNHENGIFYNDDQCWLYLDK